MLISACVVDEFGMAPYWLSPIFFSITGFKCSSTTNSSATFDRTDVNEMGRRWLLTSLIDFCLGIGTMSADFKDGDSRHSAKDEFRISVIIGASRSAFSFSSQLGTPSGPDAFLELSAANLR